MVPVLMVPIGDGERAVALDEPLRLGRDADCELRLNVPLASRRHARVSWDGRRAWVEDLGSRNGTFVNGEQLAGPRALRDGDELHIAGFTLRFALLRPAPVGEGWSAPAPEVSEDSCVTDACAAPLAVNGAVIEASDADAVKCDASHASWGQVRDEAWSDARVCETGGGGHVSADGAPVDEVLEADTAKGMADAPMDAPLAPGRRVPWHEASPAAETAAPRSVDGAAAPNAQQIVDTPANCAAESPGIRAHFHPSAATLRADTGAPRTSTFETPVDDERDWWASPIDQPWRKS